MMISVQYGLLISLLFLVYFYIHKQQKDSYKQALPVVSTDLLSVQDRVFIDQRLNQKILILKEIHCDLCNKYIRGINPLIQDVPGDLEERLGLLKSNMEFIQSMKGKIMSRSSLSPFELNALNRLMNENDSPHDYRLL